MHIYPCIKQKNPTPQTQITPHNQTELSKTHYVLSLCVRTNRQCKGIAKQRAADTSMTYSGVESKIQSTGMAHVEKAG